MNASLEAARLDIRQFVAHEEMQYERVIRMAQMGHLPKDANRITQELRRLWQVDD